MQQQMGKTGVKLIIPSEKKNLTRGKTVENFNT
jgi:hypothetical protein